MAGEACTRMTCPWDTRSWQSGPGDWRVTHSPATHHCVAGLLPVSHTCSSALVCSPLSLLLLFTCA